ncbi:phytase [Sphingobacterium daejeonense]|uniref:phytase n=1 Tax=Sphingobacterium daejeonense TaxID=371142 RepID=UPI0010C5258C|nr:phytase [Sphingobacterium daejeonense]VTP92810.1 3-phytase precursor [Sphingobacterium daejeonense]
MNKQFIILGLALAVLSSCGDKLAPVAENALKPTVTTEVVPNDTDDPAIWVNPADSTQVIVIGTDKHEKTGGLYAYDMDGKIINKVVPLDRPNNVDIAYGLNLAGKKVDVAVVTERGTNKIRVFSLPELKPLDNGGIPVFEGETEKSPMGIALYTQADSAGNKIYAVVGRKTGPTGRYLFQYELQDKDGVVVGNKVREFGSFLGGKEIEAIAVDNELGYVYYSDEGHGIHKYYADPAKGNEELAVFGLKDFKEDHEGIAIYKTSDTTGYIVASNQQNNSFNIYPREGDKGNPNQYTRIAEVPVSAIECDGADAIAMPIGSKFPKGMLVAMSNGMVFHYYDWQMFQDIIDGKK